MDYLQVHANQAFARDDENDDERRHPRNGDAAARNVYGRPGAPSPPSLPPSQRAHGPETSPAHSPSSSPYRRSSPATSPRQNPQPGSPAPERKLLAAYHADPRRAMERHDQRSRSLHEQNHWPQPAKVQPVRTAQPGSAVQASALLGRSAYSQFARLPRELAELGEGICPNPFDMKASQQALAGLGGGAPCLQESADAEPLYPAKPPMSRFGPPRQYSRNQSKAAYYPMEVTEMAKAPMADDQRYLHQAALRHPTSPALAHRPVVHSHGPGVCFSASAGSLVGGQQANRGPGFRTPAPADLAFKGEPAGPPDHLAPNSPPRAECVLGGGTYPGEAGRSSSRNAPYVGLGDKSARVQSRAPPASHKT